MRILHISDFHLDNTDREDSIVHIVEPLKNTIRAIQEQSPIDIIVFTGDFINLGGKNYDSIEEAFADCEIVLLNPLLEITNLDKEKIYFVPGNHDIDRNADSNRIELGLQQDLDTQNKINSFFLLPEGMNRINSFKKFEKEFYNGVNSVIRQTNFHSTYKVKIDDLNIGIACLNSSWRCYNSDTDKGKILVGEKQLIDSLSDLNDCKIKIALSHHHFEWLKDFDSEVVEILLKQDFNLYFTGHTHKTKVSYVDDPEGKMFSFCASGTLANSIRQPEKKYENGFSIIDYVHNEQKLTATFYIGNYPKKKFILNTAIADNGIWETKIPAGEEINKIIFEQNLIRQINTDTLPLINSRLLTYATDTNAPKSIDEIFVMPNLVLKEEFDAEKDSKNIESLDKIINCNKNYILFGTKESGKTILLDKILIDTIDTNKTHHQIPAIIDFRELKDNILKSIRECWNKSADETKNTLKEYKILLLIDNISFEDEDIFRLRSLRNFLVAYPNVRFVATYQQLFDEDIPMNLELTSMFTYEQVNLKQFKAKQIKELINKWFPNSDKYDTPKKLETLTNAFQSLNLPRTPFAVSMFLWIIEKQEYYKPINNSTLIENFIESMLKKHDMKESLREKFGYDNKIWIISHLAYKMLKHNQLNYSISYRQFTSIIDEYLKQKKFDDFKTEKIIEELLDSGIFIRDNGDIRFRFTCFFEFFLTKKIERDPKFKEEILNEDSFLQFSNEIDLYTGLNRGETDLLNLLMNRLDIGFLELEEMLSNAGKELKYNNYDGFFIRKDEKNNEKPSLVNQLHVDNVTTFLPSNKPTEEDLEVIEDNKLELQTPEKGISKKEKGNKIKNLGKLLFLVLKVVKNSEEVHDEKKPNLKLESYSKVLDKSILYAILHKAIYELFLKDSEGMPKTVTEEYTHLSNFLPLLHELLLFDNIGTQKLTSVIRDKIKLDKKNNVSDFEKFLSVFLYADIRGKDYDKIISEFIDEVKTKYIEDMIYFKLVTYYFYRSKDDDRDSFYLNLIADLMIKSKGYDKSRKNDIIERYKKRKTERLKTEND